jgi:AIR synthase-related protein
VLEELANQLRRSLGILQKQDIQVVAKSYQDDRNQGFGDTETTQATIQNRSTERSRRSLKSKTHLGDDCAAIPDRDGYLLMAAEGILPALVASDPWFAGWCAVMVNVSDIYAMGGRPIAVVDTIWSQSTDLSVPLLEGMQAAAAAYQVPIVGGHTNCHSPYSALSVAILGRAQQLITSFDAKPGDRLMMAVNLRGKSHPNYPFWNAATEADPVQLRKDLAILPQLAELGLCRAGKDISMGGIVGTSLMLLETSGCGAILDLDAIPRPFDMPLERWLISFPSYGFLLSVHPQNVAAVQALFHPRDLVCAVVGEIQPTHQLEFHSQGESIHFWNLQQAPLTGFTATEK